jgi:probable F420-dependent oxidoreductase
MGMKVGVQLPHAAFGPDALAIRDFAQAAEGLGYSHLLLYEHVLGVEHAGRNPPLLVPYDEKTEFHEPMVLLGYLAAITATIGLATGVLVLPQRDTALVAKQAAEVALLSGDRFRLGVGVGHNYVEYRGLNHDFATRGARQEEQITLLRKLWTEPLVDFQGKWHHIDRAAIAPRPSAPIPIWLGGFSDAAHRRAARVGDGFVFSLIGTGGPENELRKTGARVREWVEAEGRDPSAFGTELLVPLDLTPSEFATLVDSWRGAELDYLTLHLLGRRTPGECVHALTDYMAAMGGPDSASDVGPTSEKVD